jgi:hypothetical protein
MTDRELLEAAAKAAGLEGRVFWSEAHDTMFWVNLYDAGTEYQEDAVWNPLVDDGDALRLAVKLHLWEAVRMAHRSLGEPDCADMYAATRRAIVRAAAALTPKAP